MTSESIHPEVVVMNDGDHIVQADPDWNPVRDALAGVNDAIAVIGRAAREQLFPRALKASYLLLERRSRYANAQAFHEACAAQIGLSRSAVEDYLQLARNREAIEAELSNGTEIKSLRGALALVRSPRPAPAALPAAEAEAVDAAATMPVAVTATRQSSALDLLAPLEQAEASLTPLLQHPQLQNRSDLVQRLGQLAEVLGAVRRSLAAALRPAAAEVLTEQEDLPLVVHEQEDPPLVEAEVAAAVVVTDLPDATDHHLAEALELEVEVVTAAPPSDRAPLASRYPSTDGEAAESLQRLGWDIDRAGGQAALGERLGVSKQAVSSYRKRLQRAVGEPGQAA